MLTNIRTHESYLNFVVEQLDLQFDDKTFLTDFYSKPIVWCSLVDLTDAGTLLKHRYSSNPRGRKPRNPCDMLRSLMLMHDQKVTSVDQWVFTLKTTPIWAILSGFTPDNVPGVGTFYDFFNRLWLAPSPHLSNRKKRKLKKAKKKGKKNQKLEPKNPKIVQKLVKRALKNKKVRYTAKAHDQLQILFQSLFVHPSASKGLVGNTQSLSMMADGSPVITGGRPYGKFLCDCRKQGNWKCQCQRQFSDPDADYGWDSSREKYYYGRSLFMVAASDSPYDLPIYPRMYRASKHDSVLFVSTFHELKHWYPDWTFGEVILDSALDAYPIYEMLEHHDVSAIIDLNPRRSKQFIYNEMDINLDGVPICPIGRKMLDWGVDKKRYRRKWRCPAVVGKWTCPTPCSESAYGRTFYTSTKDNPRLFPRVKRDSKEWYKRYALRTGVERCIKRQKIDYRLEDSRGRSSRHWNIRSYIIGMCQHADAWMKEAEKNHFSTIDPIIKSLLSL
ncbi:DDE transposase [Halalkalibacterium halodurans]|uniref:DDE transposase n=1 Tax=Halalkalibacterium halodurans TaxID=86665 RepID=UPI0010671AA3|nr:DDE transposase [Halalkalibacterium halodurans]TES50091.1 DDE transposase [Halalkalibacterium halodurans]